jgi:hypothetical protein
MPKKVRSDSVEPEGNVLEKEEEKKDNDSSGSDSATYIKKNPAGISVEALGSCDRLLHFPQNPKKLTSILKPQPGFAKREISATNVNAIRPVNAKTQVKKDGVKKQSALALQVYLTGCLLYFDKLQMLWEKVQNVRMDICKIIIIDPGLKVKPNALELKVKYINVEANNSVKKKADIPFTDLQQVIETREIEDNNGATFKAYILDLNKLPEDKKQQLLVREDFKIELKINSTDFSFWLNCYAI